MKKTAAIKAGLPEEYAERLVGNTADELNATRAFRSSLDKMPRPSNEIDMEQALRRAVGTDADALKRFGIDVGGKQ